jgi:hypothetical protein
MRASLFYAMPDVSTCVAMCSAKKKRKRSADDESGDEPSDAAEPSKPTASAAIARLTVALPEGVAVVSRKKYKAKAPNPLSNAKPSEESNNTKKKEKRKYRKFY